MSNLSRPKSKSEKDKDPQIQDRLQILLTKMLNEDDNKYCVDCDSKGPRWASWNLGLFFCIRCAGIHRNLGVHISRVKSVNLDTWTPQQVASMQLMGNSRGRSVYEAEISGDFRRPQTDAQLEQFIRAKYERKKYIDKKWTPAKVPEFPVGWNELVEAERQKKDPRSVVLPPPPALTKTAPTSQPATAAKSALPLPKSPVPNLQTSAVKLPTAFSAPQLKPLGDVIALDSKSSSTSLACDLLGLSLTSDLTPQASKPDAHQSKSNYANDLLGLGMGASSISNNTSDLDFLGLETTASNGHSLSNNNNNNLFGPEATDTGSSNVPTGANQDSSKMTKDSIMALFNNKPAQQTFQPLPVQQPQFQNFRPEMNHNVSPFGNFGPPQQQQLQAVNNPFMTLSSVLATTNTTAPTIDQTTRNSAFAEINSFNFFQ